MAKPLFPDALWERIQPLLPTPKKRRFRYPGRKPVDARKAMIGILFVLKTGVERTLSWLPRKRKLRVRTERRVEFHEVLLSIGCSLICFNVLMASLC
jgi:transposase